MALMVPWVVLKPFPQQTTLNFTVGEHLIAEPAGFLAEQKKLAGITPKYGYVAEAMYGQATPKQVSYALALAKKASNWTEVAQQYGLSSEPNAFDLQQLSKVGISQLIDTLKNGGPAGGAVTQPQPHVFKPSVYGSMKGPASAAQIQYAMGLMQQLGKRKWHAAGLDKMFPKVRLSDLKAMTKSQMSELITSLKAAIANHP